MPKRQRKPQCLIPGCTKAPKYRGLCDGCYQSAAREVRAENTTWEKLVESGLALEAAVGRPLGAATKAIRDLTTKN